jgi:hypothetical protein
VGEPRVPRRAGATHGTQGAQAAVGVPASRAKLKQEPKFQIMDRIRIPAELIAEAEHYAKISRSHTSDRHDFHEGGLAAKQRKMFEGKLGEKLVKHLLQASEIPFEEDKTSHTEADYFDFRFTNGKTLDVKTRTQHFHTRTLEMKEQLERSPKDIYVSVRLFPDQYEGYVIGWASKKDFLRVNRIENNGYLDNYVLFDRELRAWERLMELLADPKKA